MSLLLAETSLVVHFFLLIELVGVGGDVGNEIPFNTESRECLFSFEGGDDAPFVAEVFEYSLDGLIGVADIVVLQLLDVDWVNDVLCQSVDSDSVYDLLFPVLLLLDFVFVLSFVWLTRVVLLGSPSGVSGGVSRRSVVAVLLPVID